MNIIATLKIKKMFLKLQHNKVILSVLYAT